MDNWRRLRWKCVSGRGVRVNWMLENGVERVGRDAGEREGMDGVGGDGFDGVLWG
jgi:hypothetical protein